MSKKINVPTYVPHDFKSGDILYADQLDYMNSGIVSAIDAVSAISDVLDTIESGSGNVYNYKGSVATKTDLPSTAEIGDVYQVTSEGISYVYNGTSWDELGSNIDMSAYALSSAVESEIDAVEEEIDNNVYTKDNMTITTPIGDITQDMLDANGGSYTVEDSAGKNAIDIIMTLLSPEKQPNDKNSKEPNMTLTTSYRTDNGSVEVGSYISAFTWTGTFTDGTYGYGSIEGTTRYTKADGAGVTPTWSISYKDENGKTETSTNATGEVAVSCQITTSGEHTYGEFTWTGTTTASTRTPVTNKGNVAANMTAYPEKTFGGTVEIKAKGVRYSYYYVGNDSASTLDSNFIRTTCTSLGKNTTNFNINNTVADGSGEACLAIPNGTTRIVLAMPGNKHQLAEVKDINGLGLDVKTNFKRYELQVAGANGYTSTVYTVFQMTNTSGIAKTNYIITIS